MTDPYKNGMRKRKYKDFLNERPKRELVVRAMRAETLDGLLHKGNSVRFYAALSQIVGRDTSEECISCARGRGPFMTCVMVYLDGQNFCANCLWLKREDTCTRLCK